MKTIVLAYHNIGCTGIEALLKSGFDICAVFTHADNPKENIWFRSVARCAAANGIEVFAPDDINHPIWVERIRQMKPDALFSFYYRNLIKKPILDIPAAGCFNLHGSLLPKYRGRCPINWAILNGEQETGVTLHHMTSRADRGDIVGQSRFPITPEDTARTVFDKADSSAGQLLAELLPLIAAGTASRIKQDQSQASCYPGRSPKDGEIDWSKQASQVGNLIRAVTDPYPGGFSNIGNRKALFWNVLTHPDWDHACAPGTVLGLDPLVVACGLGAIEVSLGQAAEGLTTSGRQMARQLGLSIGARFGSSGTDKREKKTKVLILGVNGFIGSHLGERLLQSGGYEVYGMDLNSHSIEDLRSHPDFHFFEGDISINSEWIEYHVRKCDVVIPLVAIATPIEYTKNPLRVFELDFEENLAIVRHCFKYGKRIVFPSTSEVYGLCSDESFDEEKSNLVLGPIQKQRWIYSSCKQLLDRVIWAYGEKGLRFTLFRPFNWVGPKLDSLESARIGSSRVITQLILNLVEGTPIQLVDGGKQKRCFTDVADGVDGLFRIIENKEGKCEGKIINLGNPANEYSIADMAAILVNEFEKHPLNSVLPPFAGYRHIEAVTYYGEGYQDIQHRKPSIENARKILGWKPKVNFEESVSKTLDFFLDSALAPDGVRAS